MVYNDLVYREYERHGQPRGKEPEEGPEAVMVRHIPQYKGYDGRAADDVDPAVAAQNPRIAAHGPPQHLRRDARRTLHTPRELRPLAPYLVNIQFRHIVFDIFLVSDIFLVRSLSLFQAVTLFPYFPRPIGSRVPTPRSSVSGGP